MYRLSDMVLAPLCHFLLSAALGALAYIAIMAVFNRGRSTHTEMKDLSRLRLLALCFCLAVAVIAHVLEDYTLAWF